MEGLGLDGVIIAICHQKSEDSIATSVDSKKKKKKSGEKSQELKSNQ